MNKTFSKFFTLLLAVSFFCGTLCVPISADTAENKIENSNTALTATDYVAYKQGLDATASGADVVLCDTEVLLNKNTTTDFTANVEMAGLYRITFDYISNNTSKNALELSILVDGISPFDELEKLSLSRLWQSDPDVKSYVEGANDIRPTLLEVVSWQSYTAQDAEGYVAEPFEIFLEAGAHTISLNNIGEAFKIRGLTLCGNYKDMPKYDEYIANYKDTKKYNGTTVLWQAEAFDTVSSRSLVASSDLSDAATYPLDFSYIKLNTLGGTNWKYVGNTASWVVDVPETGLYKIAIRFKQNYYNGISTHRRLKINGVVPFAEAEDLSFGYGINWQLNTLDDRFIYLEKGKNTVSLEAVLGSNSVILSDLEDIIYTLNNLYRSIITITGTSPDIYRDYALEKEIPNLIPLLQKHADDIESLIDLVEEYYDGGGSETATLNQLLVQIEDMLKSPASITKSSRLSRFKSNISSLGTWANKLREQPLEIDAIAFVGENGEEPRVKAGFFESLSYRTKRFLASFVTDYSKLGSEGDGAVTDTLRVWVSTGRDQAQLLKNMVEDTFTPEYKIGVNVELVSGGLIEAILAGRGPDIALDRAETDPVNFAMRNALYNLADFQDFKDVKNWFCECAFIPFEYLGGTYALPITQTYNMMFYRTDIFKEYDITVPKTWEELILYVLPVLNSNNMTAGIGVVTDSSIFRTLLYQSGGNIYSDDFMKAALDSQVAYEAFKTAVDFYTDYDIPQSYDFMNRFRTGEMPLAITSYMSYNNLKLSAPELNGMWEMVCIPGVADSKGNINNTQLMGSTSAVITKNCDNPNAAWSFLKWFLSSDVQARYGTDIESILGAAGRYNPANMEAMRQLSWGSEQLELLELQRSITTDIPNLPGSYFTTRAINNAFVSAVIDNKNPREALLYWNEEINFELERKREEFNFNPIKTN